MKAKQHFYALGQRAKSNGVNRYRALRFYHMDDAPKWAKHAFIAGWDAQYTDQVIEHKYEELDEKAQLHVNATYFAPESEWWEDVYEMVADDADDATQRHFVDVDRVRTGGRKGVDIDFEIDGWSNINNVTFDGFVNLRGLVDARWAERAELPIVQALFDEGILPATLLVRHLRNVEQVYTQYDYDPMEHGVFAGVEPHHLIEGLGGEAFLDNLQELAEMCVDDFKTYVAKTLEQELEYIQSDEYVQEMCAANGYVFDEDGRMI